MSEVVEATNDQRESDDKMENMKQCPNKSGSIKTIQEGSVVMHFPADQESTVFYNPVQVQNRDLSILIISIYGERRAVQIASKRYQKTLKQDHHQRRQQPSDSQNTVPKNMSSAEATTLQEKVAAYEKSLDPSQAVRDLSKENSFNGLCILDALAASGLRSLRYWKEIPGVHHVTINDLDPAAVERAQTNVVVNQLEKDQIVKNNSNVVNGNSDHLSSSPSPSQQQRGRRSRGIWLQTGDATAEMYNSRPTNKLRPGLVAQDRSWDVIDLDPYGSAAPFLDAAIQAVVNGGLIACTCTDMAALGGSRPETCVGRYGAIPVPKALYLQEMAVRILLQSMAVTAAKYGRTIHPILSVGIDFYVRVFVTIHDDKEGVNDLALRLGYVYQSTQCESFEIVPMGHKKGNVLQPRRAPGTMCVETGAEYKVGGPRKSDGDCFSPHHCYFSNMGDPNFFEISIFS